MSLVQCLDNLPANLALCYPEQLRELNKVIFTLEEEVSEEDVERLFRVCDRLAFNWIKSPGKLARMKKSKTKAERDEDKAKEEAEEGKEEEKKEEEKEEEEKEEVRPRDVQAYHLELIALLGSLIAYKGLNKIQLKKTMASVRMVTTPASEIREMKNKKSGKATKDEVVVSKELLDAVKLIQQYKLSEDKKTSKKTKGKKEETEEKEKKPRKKRASKRRPKKEEEDTAVEGKIVTEVEAPKVEAEAVAA